MPPRNSKTKAFRKYHYVHSPNAQKIPMERIYDAIVKPQNAVGNKLEEEFREYKACKIAEGIDVGSMMDAVLKADDDGDPRYINQDWYKEKVGRCTDE